jgi:hypothetical protein
MIHHLGRDILIALMILFCQQNLLGQSLPKVDCKDLKVTTWIQGSQDNLNNGEIKLALYGGTRPYKILWISYDFSGEGEHIRNLKNGYYSAVVMDANKCILRIDNIALQATTIPKN